MLVVMYCLCYDGKEYDSFIYAQIVSVISSHHMPGEAS